MKILDDDAIQIVSNIFQKDLCRLSNIIGIASTKSAEDGPIHVDYSDTDNSYTMIIAISYCEITGYNKFGYNGDQLLLEEFVLKLYPGDCLLTKADFIHAAKRNNENNIKAFWFIDNKTKLRNSIRDPEAINILEFYNPNSIFPKYVIINTRNYKDFLAPTQQKK